MYVEKTKKIIHNIPLSTLGAKILLHALSQLDGKDVSLIAKQSKSFEADVSHALISYREHIAGHLDRSKCDSDCVDY